MTPLKLSEGTYWGLALAQNEERMVLAGYNRDIATSGSWQDSTSIFASLGTGSRKSSFRNDLLDSVPEEVWGHATSEISTGICVYF